MELIKLKQIIEAALMASGEVLSLERLQQLFDDYEKPKSPQIKEALNGLMEDCADRGVELVEVASGYRLQVRKEVAPWVTRLWDEKPQRYSRALLETMSLIAYRQPITRGDIEDVRGVAVSSHIIRTLLDREWVRVVGHRDVPGRPAMYATTKEFLDYFSLKSLDELPSLAEIREMDDANENLDLINSEKKASAVREYDFASEDDVTARGEEVLAETELELEEAQKLIDQVEDNVFNKPSEEELAAEREAQRQEEAEEVRLAEEASAERKLADKFASSASPSLSDMANKTEQRLSDSDGKQVSNIDLADKIAAHQARLSGVSRDEAAPTGAVAETAHVEQSLDSGDQAPTEELTLLQQQERLMQQLMQEESQRQQSQQTIDVGDDIRAPVADDVAVPIADDIAPTTDFEGRDELAIEADLLAEAQAEKALLEREALEEAALANELQEQEQLEKEQREQAALEQERLAEEALENEEARAINDAKLDPTMKKNSLFDD